MLDKAIVIAILIVVGLCLTWVSRKFGVKVTLLRILAIWVLGAVLAALSGEGLLFDAAIVVMVAATALFLADLFVTRPKAASDAEFTRIIREANSGVLDDDGAHILLKRAIQYEIKGKIEDAKDLYQLLVRSNTSFVADAQACLKNLESR